MPACTVRPSLSWSSTRVAPPPTSPACSASHGRRSTPGFGSTPRITIPPRWRTSPAGGVTRCSMKTKSTCWRPSSPAHLRITATRTRLGRCRCSKKSWRSPRNCGCPRPPFAGRCTGWITWGSARGTTWSPTPSARKKRWVRRHIRALPRRSVVLAQDETDLLLFPPLRAAWSKRGEVARVWLSGRNARRVIFGAMNLRTGTRLLVPRQRGRSGDFQEFLAEIRWHYRGWHVALLLDEDPCHTAKASLRETEGMTLLWLPKRSPKLTPMDTLWGQGKDVISANKQYTTIDEQVDRFLGHLRSLTNQEALHTSGVLSKRFWLKAALSHLFCGPA